ncbi:hypothetical protein COJ93_26320 [Bacillus anthracis]|nr:hypothetical protein COJ93_26320 [Bacillus anthracis]
MKFKDLFANLTAGTPIKRKEWRGYWKYENGNVVIYTKTGEVIDLKETNDILFTISHITQDDWEVATNENCDIEVK